MRFDRQAHNNYSGMTVTPLWMRRSHQSTRIRVLTEVNLVMWSYSKTHKKTRIPDAYKRHAHRRYHEVYRLNIKIQDVMKTIVPR